MKATEARTLNQKFKEAQVEDLNYDELYREISKQATKGAKILKDYYKFVVGDQPYMTKHLKDAIDNHVRNLGYSIGEEKNSQYKNAYYYISWEEV